MIQKQIYLTERQQAMLAAMAQDQGKKQSELIREAIDYLIDKTRHSRHLAVLNEAAGMWQNRTDLPEFRALRKKWDRA